VKSLAHLHSCFAAQFKLVTVAVLLLVIVLVSVAVSVGKCRQQLLNEWHSTVVDSRTNV